MSSTLYLPRRLSANDKTYTEGELLLASNYVVVLSEPGGGKTALLKSLAEQLGVLSVSANVFSYRGRAAQNSALVIDAFDELAKIDHTGINRLLANASDVNPTHVIISSRSSEWDNAATHAFADFLAHEPLVVKLCEFDEDEQRAIFDHHVEGEDFSAFRSEVARFDLDALLPNPQFLILFADAYLESGRHFADKRSIFSLAVERLAREVNPKVSNNHNAVPIADKISFGSEVFAKVLLSGAEGIATSEADESRIYPLLGSLSGKDKPSANILATRLFRPGDLLGQHHPVHKVVAEYCAADYLTKRIVDPLDPLTLSKCLPIIAPNSTVRDELRGLLGWMASLGNRGIEEATIQLDPYAVLANGDPSQLESSSKRLLISRLKYVESKDPYFRRGDFWRRFSVAGFFTQDVMDEIRPILEFGNEGHLRDLILELLVGSKAVEQLENELQQILLAPEESESTRLLVSKSLLEIASHDHLSNVMILIGEATQVSLRVAAEIIGSRYSDTFDHSVHLAFYRSCAGLYSRGYDHYDRTVGTRYFVKRLIETLDLEIIEWLLDELCVDLVCTCGKECYECGCRTGVSKIIGSMLDRFFELAPTPYNPCLVWKWIENLDFHQKKSASQSRAVQVLQEDTELRQGLIAHVFGGLVDRDVIFETKVRKFDFHSHSGLGLYSEDTKFLADLAFKTDNPILWASFIPYHQKHDNREARGLDNFRRHLRGHALAKPEFMREWVKTNRSAMQLERLHGMPRLLRKIGRNRRKQQNFHAESIKYVQENRELVESGRHWGCLVRFADLVLMHPDKIKDEFGDESIVRIGLRNCLAFITPYVPDLLKLAELRCTSKSYLAEPILFASCLEIMRLKHSLDEVDSQLLKSLRATINVNYSAVTKDEKDALKREVDRRVFSDHASVEDFLRRYIEPQLASAECQCPDIWLLRSDDVFSHLRSGLSIEWLRRFDNLTLGALDTLFDISAQFSNPDALVEVIHERCRGLISADIDANENEDLNQRRKFWFVRALYFVSDISESQWEWLQADRDTVLALNERSGRFSHLHHSSWPSLSAVKIEAILNAFISQWPRVDLPSHWGTESPKEENAYRFLKDLVWSLNSFDSDDALPILEHLLADYRFEDMYKDLSSIHSSQLRKRALRDFVAPTPIEVVSLLDNGAVVTVEGLRQLVIEELHGFQKAIDGGEFNTGNLFYDKEERLGEVPATLIIAERLHLRLEPQGISVTPEHQLKDSNRSDFTVTKMIGGKRKLLVTEVKGQWHKELYTAAQDQLNERYSIHPDAEQQGIFLVLWFGQGEKVAGRKTHGLASAQELKDRIESALPHEMMGLIDVFVLDVSKAGKQLTQPQMINSRE
ncbi:hypothetical protein [Pseudomonas batumici]|uniref:Uncharacterized protein n=1 Tax=Pseudomonas batumici TaxID=226910 RepID=A0A0C2EYA8_9PSED|nr:hypothetical protein [Pseudomonas batumici]KIH83758.1 hypothetical protein UCMB321_2500 [Pseudomonas batumici]